MPLGFLCDLRCVARFGNFWKVRRIIWGMKTRSTTLADRPEAFWILRLCKCGLTEEKSCFATTVFVLSTCSGPHEKRVQIALNHFSRTCPPCLLGPCARVRYQKDFGPVLMGRRVHDHVTCNCPRFLSMGLQSCQRRLCSGESLCLQNPESFSALADSFSQWNSQSCEYWYTRLWPNLLTKKWRAREHTYVGSCLELHGV